MKIEQVRLKKTLKAGKNVWVEGSYFPNIEYPSIPHDILLEVKLGTGTVEVTEYGAPEVVVPDKPDATSISGNIVTFSPTGVPKEGAPTKVNQKESGAKKSKPKLVRR